MTITKVVQHMRFAVSHIYVTYIPCELGPSKRMLFIYLCILIYLKIYKLMKNLLSLKSNLSTSL